MKRVCFFQTHTGSKHIGSFYGVHTLNTTFLHTETRTHTLQCITAGSCHFDTVKGTHAPKKILTIGYIHTHKEVHTTCLYSVNRHFISLQEKLLHSLSRAEIEKSVECHWLVQKPHTHILLS